MREQIPALGRRYCSLTVGVGVVAYTVAVDCTAIFIDGGAVRVFAYAVAADAALRMGNARSQYES